MKNSEGSYQTIQLILLSIYQKEMKSVSQCSVLLCSLQHYSQLPRYRNNYLLINEWIKKENVRYIYISSGTLFSLKANPAISDNMDKHGGHYAKRSQKHKYCMTSLMCNLKKSLIKAENVVARG